MANTDDKHQCILCNKNFNSLDLLKEHLRPGCKLDKYEAGEIEIINGKYQCGSCHDLLDSLTDLEKHLTFECNDDAESNNIYKFDQKKFAKQIFPESKTAGDIYIVVNDSTITNIYKIGITTNLIARLSQFRCGSICEPRLYYYYPCKDIKKADGILKRRFKKYNIKREIYEGDINIFRDIIKEEIRIINGGKVFEYEAETKHKILAHCIECKKIFSSEGDLEYHILNSLHMISLREDIEYSKNDLKKIIKNQRKIIDHHKEMRNDDIAHIRENGEIVKQIDLLIKKHQENDASLETD